MHDLRLRLHQGNKDQKDLLGGKGANLAEMTNLGLPVPPGFTISTEACRAYLEAGDVPDGLAGEVDEHLRALEEAMGRRSATPTTRCWCQRAVRREVLDARDDGDGPQRRAQRRVGARPGRARATTSGSRWTPTAGCSRCSAPRCSASTAEVFSEALDAAEEGPRHRPTTSTSTSTTCAGWSRRSRSASASTPAATSRRTRASSWTSRCARSSTRGTPTARGPLPPPGADPRGPRHRRQRAGHGVRQPRRRLRAPASPSPATRRPGNQGVYGDYLQNAQGEDVVAGIRNTVSLADLERDRQDVVRRAARRS